jgi:transcriptional regulator with XRE-family HTH domain
MSTGFGNMADDNDLTTVGGRIEYARRLKGIPSQAALARLLKKKRQIVNRWINDPEQPPGEDSIDALAHELGVTASWLRYGPAGATPSVSRETAPAYVEALSEAAGTLELMAMGLRQKVANLRGDSSTAGTSRPRKADEDQRGPKDGGACG